jgi:hypothetical protein
VLPGARRPLELSVRAGTILAATAYVLIATATPGAALSCRWTAPPFARVLDGSQLPDLHARPDFGPDAAPAVLPTPAPYAWNPVFPIDRAGRVHDRADGAVSSIITISGGGCAPAHVAVLVYGDGFVPQRGLALNVGQSQTHDELSNGNGDFATVTLHAEVEAPLRLRNVWISTDIRSVGYRHVAGDVTDAGGAGQTFRPDFDVRDDSVELRAGYAPERFGPTLELAYLNAATNALRPSVSGAGVAAEVPPALGEALSGFGAFSYYPNLTGGGVAYGAVRYRFGGVLSLASVFGQPYYFELSYLGDHRWNRSNAPSAISYRSVMLGIGYRFGGIP